MIFTLLFFYNAPCKKSSLSYSLVLIPWKPPQTFYCLNIPSYWCRDFLWGFIHFFKKKLLSFASSSYPVKWVKQFPEPAAPCSALLVCDDRVAAKFCKECSLGHRGEGGILHGLCFLPILSNKQAKSLWPLFRHIPFRQPHKWARKEVPSQSLEKTERNKGKHCVSKQTSSLCCPSLLPNSYRN